MTETSETTARELVERLNASSRAWQTGRSNYTSNHALPDESTEAIERALSRMVAAVGGAADIQLACAGVSGSSDGKTYGLLVLTDTLVIDTEFQSGDTDMKVNIMPRAALVGITVTGAAHYEDGYASALKFTAEYGNGRSFDFPLQGDASSAQRWIGDLLTELKTDLATPLAVLQRPHSS